jgi:hypothetical protein
MDLIENLPLSVNNIDCTRIDLSLNIVLLIFFPIKAAELSYLKLCYHDRFGKFACYGYMTGSRNTNKKAIHICPLLTG